MKEEISFGSVLRERRKEKGLTAMQLADITGISQSYISQLENNKFTPSSEIIVKISKAIDLPFSYLYILAGKDTKFSDFALEPGTLEIIKTIDDFGDLKEFNSYEEFVADTKDRLKDQTPAGLDENSPHIKNFFNAIKTLQAIDDFHLSEKKAEDDQRLLDRFVQIGIATDIEQLLANNEERLVYKGKPISMKDRKKFLQIADIVFNNDEEEQNNTDNGHLSAREIDDLEEG